jgi:hypothetical protein
LDNLTASLGIGNFPGAAQSAASKLASRVSKAKVRTVVQPKAIGTAINVGAPVINQTARGQRVKHTELVDEVTVSDVFLATEYDLNPTDETVFPYLNTIAQLYQTYKVHSCKVVYIASVGSDVNGSIYFAVDYDNLMGPPLSSTQAMAFTTKQDTTAWSPVEMALNPAAIHRVTKAKTVAEVTEPLDMMSVIGKLFVCSDGASAVATCGKFYLDYDIEFFDSQLATTTGSMPTSFGQYYNGMTFVTGSGIGVFANVQNVDGTSVAPYPTGAVNTDIIVGPDAASPVLGIGPAFSFKEPGTYMLTSLVQVTMPAAHTGFFGLGASPMGAATSVIGGGSLVNGGAAPLTIEVRPYFIFHINYPDSYIYLAYTTTAVVGITLQIQSQIVTMIGWNHSDTAMWRRYCDAARRAEKRLERRKKMTFFGPKVESFVKFVAEHSREPIDEMDKLSVVSEAPVMVHTTPQPPPSAAPPLLRYTPAQAFKR